MRMLRIIMTTALVLPFSISPVHAASAMTWDSSTKIKGVVTIAAGQVVSVAANTAIDVADGSKIIVAGTLIAPSGLVLKGKNWAGLEVAGLAQLTNFEESGASTPLRIAPTGTIELHGAKILGLKGVSVVEGVLVADHLEYIKGSGAGIESSGGKGSISIDQSVITGPGRGSGDFFSFAGLKSFSLTNSQMSGAHCAFHITGIGNMVLTNDYIFDNAYGFMMYGSSKTGVRKITQTTITNNSFGFDEGSAATRNGAISITESYVKGNGKDLGLYTGKVKISNPALKSPHL